MSAPGARGSMQVCDPHSARFFPSYLLTSTILEKSQSLPAILNKKVLFIRSQIWGVAGMILGDVALGQPLVALGVCASTPRERKRGVVFCQRGCQ